MKRLLLLSLLGISMCACSNEDADTTAATVSKTKEITPQTNFKLKPEATVILDRYVKNQGTLSQDESTKIFAADAKTYLIDKDITTQGLNDSEVINLFLNSI
jgi:hypothetical protein